MLVTFTPYLKRCDDFITGITVTVKLGDEAMDSLLGMKAEGNTYLEETGDVIYWDWYDAGEQIGKILANCKNAGTLFVLVMHSMNGTGPQTVMVVADEYGNTMVMDGDAIAIENTGIVMFGGGKNNKDDKDDKGDSNSKEIVLDRESSHESARNTLMDELDKTGAFKNGSKAYTGRLESSYGYGKQIGRQSLDGKVRWRLDYDPEIGVHYNIEDFSKGKGANAIKEVIPIDISYNEYKAIIDSWN